MRSGYWIVLMAIVGFAAIGCEDADYQSYKEAPLSETSDHGHDHGEVGKHGGHVLELDDAHAHHGELVFDAKTRDITVYFYGAEVGEAHAATNVTLELHVADGHKDLTGKPMPLDGETDETASRWSFSGAELPENIKGEEQLDGHLEVTMDGTPFSYGLEPHSHGDEHGHADEPGHDDDHGHAEKPGHDEAPKEHAEGDKHAEVGEEEAKSK